MVKKETETLNPFLEKKDGSKDILELFKDIPEVKLKELRKDELPDIIKDENTNNAVDTFFKSIVDNLYSKENISLKTEYLNEDENFAGAKLEFLTSECGFQMGKKFLPIWEEKRVSLNRKSRQEIIMALWQRQNEIQEQERKKDIENRVGL